ncbi:MAG TPA: DUF1904 family protein [Bacillota bacterium]|nr:DUF1904 family protein [Bacillota bacterium]
MPFLRFKGFEHDFVRQIAPEVILQIVRLADVTEEKVKIELVPIIRITDTPLSLEIYIFPRDQKKHDQIAAAMNQIFEDHGCIGVHIFFILLNPELYYKNGMPLLTKQGTQ